MNKKLLSAVVLGATAIAMAEGEAYTWPTYNSKLNYNFKDQGITYSKPTKDVNGSCVKKAESVNGVYHGEYWAFYHGANKNPLVTESAITPLLKRFDTDFAYITDSLGWPRDSRVRNGYYSAVYLYGSDACTGSNDPEATGGWETYVDNYPSVIASYYPVYSFDPKCTYSDKEAQMSAMIHEGIHAILADLGAAHVHWFQEGGNTWLQQEMEVRRGNQSEYGGMGFLNAGNLMAPFVPIESYSGWLLDGTFGGPGAQGVDAGQGVCNWRNTLGGVQYGNLFPTFLGLWVAQGAVPWIWVNIPNNNGKYILESMAAAVGEEEVRSIIMEYRAKLAMLDMKKWSGEMKNLLNQNVGANIKCEYTPCANTVDEWYVTPYVQTTNNGGVLTPEERTTPGWTGANVIPLKVNSGAKSVKLTLQKGWDVKTGNAASTGDGVKLDGNLTDMTLMIAYRATDGTPVYSYPAFGANQAVLNLDKAPYKDVVFAIVTNTTYKNDRTKHYTYKLKLDEGVSGAADYKTKWYNDFPLAYDWDNAKVVTGGSSSSGKVTSSSSRGETAACSSSQKMASSSSSKGGNNEIGSSANQPATVAATFPVEIKLPISEDYTGVKFDIKASDAAKALGISENALGTATFFAVEPNGNENTNTTADGKGHWFGKDGSVVAWGENAYVFCEFDFVSKSAVVGHYPNRVSDGDTFKIKQGISANGKKVVYEISVKITNGESSAATEEPMVAKGNYNMNFAPATHMSLDYTQGKIVVDFKLERNDNAKISLFTGYGALVAKNFTDKLSAGWHQQVFDTKALGLPSGTYIVKVSTGSFRETKSLTVAR